jgi:mercuric ion transport protein
MATQSLEGDPAVDSTESGLARGLLAAGGLFGALLASSCCIVPLVFVTLGIGGTWMGQLTAMEPYKPILVAVTVAFLGFSFWHVYFKPRAVCADGSFCAMPASNRVTQFVLWSATALVALAATVNYWAPLFY